MKRSVSYNSLLRPLASYHLACRMVCPLVISDITDYTDFSKHRYSHDAHGTSCSFTGQDRPEYGRHAIESSQHRLDHKINYSSCLLGLDLCGKGRKDNILNRIINVGQPVGLYVKSYLIGRGVEFPGQSGDMPNNLQRARLDVAVRPIMTGYGLS